MLKSYSVKPWNFPLVRHPDLYLRSLKSFLQAPNALIPIVGNIDGVTERGGVNQLPQKKNPQVP